MSSVCVKRMHISQDTEVTGVLHFPDKNRFMSVGGTEESPPPRSARCKAHPQAVSL